MNRNKSALVFTLTGLFVLALAPLAYAFTTPSSGSVLYDVYDLAINDILKGPAGFVIATGLIGMGVGAATMGKGIVLPVMSVIGGALIYKLDGVVESLGYSLDAVSHLHAAGTVMSQASAILHQMAGLFF